MLLFLVTGRMPRSGKLPVLNLLRPKIIAPIQFKLGRADGHLAPLVCSKFHLNRHGVGIQPPKYQISTFW